MVPKIYKGLSALVKRERSLREFYEIQLSVDGCWEMKMWLGQRLIQICGR